MRSIRFRTLGCYPLTGAVQSEASTLTRKSSKKCFLTTTSERQGRAIDEDQGASMEVKSSKGIFQGMRDMKDQIYKPDALIAQDIDAYPESNQNKSLLRFITCGSVDDGKSTLIGRLLYDGKMIFEDQLAQLEADSKKIGTQGQEIDFAL